MVVSFFMWSVAPDCSSVLLPYPITSLSSPMTCQYTNIPLLNINVHIIRTLLLILILVQDPLSDPSAFGPTSGIGHKPDIQIQIRKFPTLLMRDVFLVFNADVLGNYAQ